MAMSQVEYHTMVPEYQCVCKLISQSMICDLMGKRLHRECRVSKTASPHSFFMRTGGLCWNYIKHRCSCVSH